MHEVSTLSKLTFHFPQEAVSSISEAAEADPGHFDGLNHPGQPPNFPLGQATLGLGGIFLGMVSGWFEWEGMVGGGQKRKGPQCSTFGILKAPPPLHSLKAAGRLRMVSATPEGGRIGKTWGERATNLDAWICFSRDKGPYPSPPPQPLFLS